MLSLWNYIRFPASNDTDEAEIKNGSFHRIYSDCGSDVSDESDAESELLLNTSLQSNRSIRSIRSGKHSLRCNNSSLNASFVSQVPSMFSTSTFAGEKPLCASMKNLSQVNHFDSESIRCFNGASHMDLTRDPYDGNQSVHPTVIRSSFGNRAHLDHFGSRPLSSASLTGSVNQLYARDATTFTGRCSSRLSMNDGPNEFERDITQLSIGDVAKHRENFHSNNINQTNESLAFRQRKTLLLPARLSYHENNRQDASSISSIAANQSSWLAGGYWNNTTSLQQRQQYAA